MTIVRDNVLVQGLGLPGDVEQTPYNTVIFIQNGTVSSNNIYNFYKHCFEYRNRWAPNNQFHTVLDIVRIARDRRHIY